MIRNKIAAFAVTVLFLCHCRQTGQEPRYVLSAPADKKYAQISADHSAVLPNGRLVTPAGKSIRVAPHPYGLTLSPDETTIITSNSGTFPFSLSIIRNYRSDQPNVRQIERKEQDSKETLETVFMGLAVSPDNRTVYASSGGSGEILLFDLDSAQRIDAISTNGRFADGEFKEAYLGELVLNRAGTLLYVVDQANFRLVVIDVVKRQVLCNVQVGRYPFGVALSKDESKIYVANVGMFEYKTIQGYNPEKPVETTVTFPPFGFPSQEALDGTVCEGKTVPGLGDPNTSESFSVWTVDVADPAQARVIARVKTGHLVGEKLEEYTTIGGSGPNSITAGERYVYVSNGNNDCITVLNAENGEIVKDIDLALHADLKHLRGVLPFGLCLSPKEDRLYVAESGINAVAVIDARSHVVLGQIPTGWFPSKLAVSRDGKTLYVASAKGLGAGPNAGANHDPEDSQNIGHLMRGLVTIFPAPTDRELKRYTQQVLDNNVRRTALHSFRGAKKNPVPPITGLYKSPIKHIVYITKENRTYDEVFGAVAKGKGDPDLSLYGVYRDVVNENTGKRVDSCLAMPNHIALAERFSMSDNFYCDSDHSADGHRWLVNTYPNQWVETSTSAHYGKGKRHQSLDAKGRLGFPGASGAIYPEDYNEGGAIWEHFDRHGIRFANFGLGFEFAAGYEEQRDKYTGIRLAANYPMPKPLFDNTSRQFATFNMNIPDQFRVDMFEEEFQRRWASGQQPFPQVITMMLPNDHASDPRPKDGYPFHASYMSDNDLALGRVIELLSHSPYWPEMAIFITEDDAQGGLDHVDAHRSILLVISPYAKPGYISSEHTSMPSIIKTIFLILDLPPLNLYDACATDLADCFADTLVNLTPYKALPVDVRVFDAQKALDPFDKEFNWKAVIQSESLDNPALLRHEREEKYREYRQRKSAAAPSGR